MDAFEQLKVDIATLISTAGDTIDQLVSEAQKHMAALAAQAAVHQEIPGAPQYNPEAFATQITQLSSDVRLATQRLKDQAAVILGVPAAAVADATKSAEQDVQAIIAAHIAASAQPDPASAPPSEVATPSSASLPAVEFGAATISPDTFKAGA